MKYIIVFIFLFFITSCGFHLRGEMDFPPFFNNIYIETKDPYSHFSKQVILFFKLSNITILTHSNNATYILRIRNETTSDRMIGYDPRSHFRQYSLLLTVTFELLDAKENLLLGPETLTQSKIITINDSRMLGGSNEAKMMYDQMRQEIIYLMMSRLASNDVKNILNFKNDEIKRIP